LIGAGRWIIFALNRENLYMEIMLPLDKMTIEDKIRTMEIIRDDLCKNADSIKSPEWHKAKKIFLILHYEN
jgi:hypothetical protein